MKTLVKIIVCLVILVVQACLLKVAYNKGKQDKQTETEFLQLEIHRIS